MDQHFTAGPRDGENSESPAAVPIASGQEYRANTTVTSASSAEAARRGRIEPQPKQLAAVWCGRRELHGLGVRLHAHGATAKRSMPTCATPTDGVELLQFAEYRDFGLEGWYHVLNAGFRFPAVGASDYPTVARSATAGLRFDRGADPTFDEWIAPREDGASYDSRCCVVCGRTSAGDTLTLPHGDPTWPSGFACNHGRPVENCN